MDICKKEIALTLAGDLPISASQEERGDVCRGSAYSYPVVCRIPLRTMCRREFGKCFATKLKDVKCVQIAGFVKCLEIWVLVFLLGAVGFCVVLVLTSPAH